MNLGKFINKLLAPTGLVITRRNTIADLVLGQANESLSEVNSASHDVQLTLLRGQISTKWSTVDFILRRTLDTTAPRVCPLCGYTAADMQFGRLRSHCIFGGGDLLRHVCPACEVTYGPDKMFDLTAAQLAEDYEWHYKAYEEGDSTERELRAFFALKPNKSGVYLNYGAGGWSKSVQKLRAEGWNVYAYEPHSSASCSGQHDWLIGSSSQLQTIRFDGIFSNNVLEHFRHPVQELKEMGRLLRKGGHMAHATPCFDYLYEYTRFHLFFFTGKAKDLLMEQANLQLVEEVIDGDFICRVMKPSIQSAYHV
jgi:SAM-dependent methyltransferase